MDPARTGDTHTGARPMQYYETRHFPTADDPAKTFSSDARGAHVLVDPRGGQIDIWSLMSDGTKIAVGDSPFTSAASLDITVRQATILIEVTGAATYEFRQ